MYKATPLAEVPEGATPGSDNENGGSGIAGWIWALVIALVLAVAALIFGFARKKRGSEE